MTSRTFLITGHKGRLGNDFCHYLLKKGFNVIGFDIGVRESHTILGESFFWEINVDVTNEKTISDAVEKIKSQNLTLTALVHFAAMNPSLNELTRGYDLRSQKVDQIQRFIDVGTLGAVRILQNIYEQLEKQSSVLFIGSDLSLISPNQSLYCVCSSKDASHEHWHSCPIKPLAYSIDKSAIIGLTRYLSTFYAKSEKNIRVNCACIGAVDFDFSQSFKDKISSLIPLGRPANPGEYNDLFFFLSSDQSSYMTGAVISCDGGRTSW